jgi:uncharacterized RDD family membrane protein YckC
VIDTYVKDFRRWTAGSREHRETLMRELEAHLREAQKAGRLEEALERFGSPREAARAFSAGHPLPPAPLRRRLAAAAADLLPFGSLVLIAYWHPDWPGTYPEDTTRLILLGLAVFWWCLVLPLAEARFGRTPGKRLFGLRVVSEDGTAISLGQAIFRRVAPFIGFPLLVVDLPAALADSRHRRAFDRAAGTLVVAEREEPQVGTRMREWRELGEHLMAYLSVSLVLVLLWALGWPFRDFFWPVVPIVGWGVGLAAYVWKTLPRARSGGSSQARAPR